MPALGLRVFVPSKTQIGALWRSIYLSVNVEALIQLVLRHNDVLEGASTVTLELLLVPQPLIFKLPLVLFHVLLETIKKLCLHAARELVDLLYLQSIDTLCRLALYLGQFLSLEAL
jgi:hypothetical protein